MTPVLERILRIIREIQKMQQVGNDRPLNLNLCALLQFVNPTQSTKYKAQSSNTQTVSLTAGLSHFLHQLTELPRGVEISDRHVLVHLAAR